MAAARKVADREKSKEKSRCSDSSADELVEESFSDEETLPEKSAK